MKRSLILLSSLMISATLFSQTTDSTKRAQAKAELKLNKLIAKYQFPSDYVETIKTKLIEFEIKKENISAKYTGKNLPEEKKLELSTVNNELNIWREYITDTYERAFKQWDKINEKYTVDLDLKQKYIDYHFYIQLTPSSIIDGSLNNIIVSSELKTILEKIAYQEADRVTRKCSSLGEFENTIIELSNKELYDHLYHKLEENIQGKTNIKLVRDSDAYCEFASGVAVRLQESEEEKRIDERNSFFTKKAVEIGLSESSAQKILQLIEKRKADLANYKAANKASENSMSSLFENTATKTKTQIKQEFSRNLSEIIDYKQFEKLFGEEFVMNTQQKTLGRTKALFEDYEFNDDQKKEITSNITTFYYNEELTTAYYYFDKKLKKQRLSALRYHFEKDFNTLLSEFGYKTSENVNIGFKWD